MTEQTENVETTETTENVAPAEDSLVTENKSESEGLNISDLAQVKMIIDVAASRGAFKPQEMTVVGATYTKISSFIESITKGGN